MNDRNILISAANASLLMLPSWIWAQTPSVPDQPDWDRYMWHMMWGGGGYGMFLGPLFMILTLAVVVAVVVLLVRWLGGPWHGAQPPYQPPASRTPLDILKERFARGEINKEEFEERRRVLEQ